MVRSRLLDSTNSFSFYSACRIEKILSFQTFSDKTYSHSLEIFAWMWAASAGGRLGMSPLAPGPATDSGRKDGNDNEFYFSVRRDHPLSIGLVWGCSVCDAL